MNGHPNRVRPLHSRGSVDSPNMTPLQIQQIDQLAEQAVNR